MIDFKCSVTMPDTESASKLRADLIEYATKGPSLGVMGMTASPGPSHPTRVTVGFKKVFQHLITATSDRTELTRLIVTANPSSIEDLTCYVLEVQISAHLREHLIHDDADADNEFLRAPISELFGETDAARPMSIMSILEANGITTIGHLVQKSAKDIMALYGIGGASLGLIREALATRGLALQ